MAKLIVIGAQWGDEGKGKVVDILSSETDLVVRYQGGANAGHTVVVDGKQIILHHLPSGVLSPHTRNIIGNGCVVDPELLVEEIDMAKNNGVTLTPGNLTISGRAHMVTPVHKFMDRLLNERLGTTCRGIGPCYVDKVNRSGLLLEQVFDGALADAFRTHAEEFRRICETLHGEQFLDIEAAREVFLTSCEKVKPYIGDSMGQIHEAVVRGERILFEGAQGTLLDVDHGTYPFVTSSHTTIGGALTGGGVYIEFDGRIGIVKAYTTRVGTGPFPTEEQGAVGELLREKGREYGATTGRPRRCGWLDLPPLRKACIINGFNYIALTKLDCLSGIEDLKMAVGRDAGEEPVYRSFEGWEESILGITAYDKLPGPCRKYVEFIEESLELPIDLISTGPDRSHTILKRAP